MSRAIYALLRRLSPPDDPSSDAALLHRFVQHRDQTAFELLVWRHGGLVLGVCRRILRDEHAAEDAFQATFLILARKAGAVRGSLAGWLHQVARRVCWRARKRNPVPMEPGSEVGVNTPDPLLSAELQAVLDEEIARLPEKQRLTVVLCYLQGRTTDDAAKLLGIPRGTVLSRLDAARKRLRQTLTGRGITVPITLLTGSLVAPELTAEGCRTATEAAVGFLTSPAITSIPTQLAHEVMQMTARKTMLGVATVLVLTAGVGTGVGLVMAQGGKTPATKAAEKLAEGQKPEAAKAEQKPDAGQRENTQKRKQTALERIEVQFAKLEAEVTAYGGDPKTIQAEIDQLSKALLENQMQRLRSNDTPGIEGKLRIEFEAADQALKMAEIAPIPPDILERAIGLHPKVVETKKDLDQKQVTLSQSKLAYTDPERIKLDDAYKSAKKAHQELRDQVKPEIERYLRVPDAVRLAKERDERNRAYSALKYSEIQLRDTRDHLQMIQHEKREKLRSLTKIYDDYELLREKRKQLKRELLDLDSE